MANTNFKVKNGIDLGTPLTVSNGGTGLSALGSANQVLRTNAGVTALEWATVSGTGTVTSIDVSGGSTGLSTSGGPVTGSGTITLAGTLAIANGGTGQTTANNALNALLPAQSGNNGKVLSTDGSTTSWITSGGGSGVTTPTANTIAQRDSNADLYANNFVSSSDLILKTNIRPIETPTDLILSLTGHRFTFIDNGQESIGFIAQEVEQVLPELVYEQETKAVNYLAIIGILVESIKELNQRIEVLENK